MTFFLYEPGTVESVVGDKTYVEYTVKDDVTGYMMSKRFPVLTKEYDQKVVDQMIVAKVEEHNAPPPKPPVTVNAVVAKIAEVIADQKMTADEKIAALDAYQKQVDPKADAAADVAADAAVDVVP